MTPINLTLDLACNSRVIQGLIMYDPDNEFDATGKLLRCSIQADLGRWDSEGESYIVNLLNILPGDLLQAARTVPSF